MANSSCGYIKLTFARLIGKNNNNLYLRRLCKPCEFLNLQKSNFSNMKCVNCGTALLLVKFKKNVFNYRMLCIHHGESLDTFTENLVQEKGIKWLGAFIRIPENYKHTLPVTHMKQSDVNINNVSPLKLQDITEIVKFLRQSVNNYNTKLIATILQSCEAQSIIVPSDILNDIAALFAVHGYKDGIYLAQNLCKSSNPVEFKINARFLHYVAEALWIQGNIKQSLKMFDQVYDEYPHKRSEVKVMLRRLFIHVIKMHGEASLVNIVNFVSSFSKKYSDFSLMAYLWKDLFESEWFSDQQLASELHSKHRELTSSINGIIPIMAKQLLTHHKLDTFYRLIEVTLCNDMTKQTQLLLQLLFEYKYVAGDLQACSHIMDTSVILDIPLKEDQCNRFIELLLHRKKKFPQCDIKKTPPYTYKF